MPHVTFIYPSVGRFPGTKYIRSWQMQPLAIAALSGLTPQSWKRTFFDDRLEQINYDRPTDLVGISIETFTARRGYQIAEEYKKRGVPVVMGGYHATFCPDEVLEYVDAVCVGEAEDVWTKIINDAEQNKLCGKYIASSKSRTLFSNFDRSIFKGKKYFKFALVETSRGCNFQCTFCSITAFHKERCKYRPIHDIVQEIRNLKEKNIFIVDDNFASDFNRARELFSALEGLKIRWVGQAGINITNNVKLLDLMAKSGCVGLLIGFESLEPESLCFVNKQVNKRADYARGLQELRKRGLAVYGTFLLGLPHDSEETVNAILNFSIKEKLFIAAFNHIVPFPGTPLYNELEIKNKLIYKKWWLSEEYRFGDVPYNPETVSAQGLQEWCHRVRKKFFGVLSIFRRSIDVFIYSKSLRKIIMYFGLNCLLHKEVSQKRGLPLGERDERVI
ncbi:B12-binding domain-containing radical SAM protein [Chlamydiota bacterium]